VVLITGCDTGFGQMLAMKLHKVDGFHIIAGCLTERGQGQYQNMKNISSILLDVTKADSIGAAIQAAQKLCDDHGLYGIVNNAGIAESAPFEWTSDASFRKVMEVNFFGMVAVTRAALPLLRRYPGNSRIVNVASIAGLLSLTNSVSYSCSKYAVEAFSDGLRREMLTFSNVSVHCIEPGYHSTGIIKERLLLENLERAWNGTNDEVKSYYKGAEGLGPAMIAWCSVFRSSQPEKVADAMCHSLTSSFPKRRYTVGWDANLLWKPLSFLPGWLQDIVLSIIIPVLVGLDRKWRNTNRVKSGWDMRILGIGLLSFCFLISSGIGYASAVMMFFAIMFVAITAFK